MAFIIALLLGVGLTALVLWIRSRGIAVRWYEWLIGAVGLLLVIAAVQHYFGSLAERYDTAGMLGLLVFGVPALILLVAAWMLIARHNRVSA